MVTLPTYTGQGSISAGTDTLRLNRKEDGGGAAIAHLGSQIGAYGLQMAKGEYAAAAAEDAEQKRVDGLGDALVRETMETEWHQKQADLEANADPSGKDYVKSVEDAFQDHMGEYSDKWSNRRYAENQVLNARFRDKVVSHAIDYQTRTRLQADQAVAKKVVTDLAAAVSENGALFDTALKELELRADTQGFDGRVKAAFLSSGREALETARLSVEVRDRPLAVISAGKGAFADMPTATAGEEVQKIARGAAASGTDLRTMLAIAKLESDLNPNAVNPKSSAKGVFQFVKNGIGGANPTGDTEEQAKIAGLFYAKQTERLEASGIKATPGKLYMFHTMGEGLAKNVLMYNESESSRPMRDVLTATYPTRPELAAQIAANNPTLYNSNMTVGDVVVNYEKKMAGAIEATKGYVTGDTLTTDEVARTRMSELLGVPIEKIGAAQLVRAIDDAQKAYMSGNKEQFKLDNGRAIHDGLIRVDPYDKTEVKDLHDFAKTTGIADAMFSQDEATWKAGFKAARSAVSNANVIPQPYLHAARELVMNGDASNPAKARAFQFLADIARDNEVAWDASQVPEPVKARIKQYRALTEGDDAIVTPAEALKRITFEHSPAGDSSKRAAQELFKAHKGRELAALNVGEVDAAVSKGLWRNADFFATDNATNDVRRQAMFDNYKQSYEGYRIEGKDIETSKKLALQDIKDNYQVTNVFRGGLERGEITRYRIESKYPPVDAEHPWQWIEKEGRTLVNQAAAAAGVDLNIDKRNPGRLVRELNIRLMPTSRTAEDWKLDGKRPGYNLMYQNPKTNLWELAVEDWRPNVKDAQEVFDAQFRDRSSKAKARSDAMAIGLSSGVYAP